MAKAKGMAGLVAAVSAAAMLCALPAAAKPEPKRKLTASAAANTTLKPETLGSFTPSMLDSAKRVGAMLSASTQERSFRFTPSLV